MPGKARRVFVGDIQGCLGSLERLLKAVRFRPGKDSLRPVGDLVNKGPDSEGVVRLCMELGAQPVLGNHDRARLATDGLAGKLAGWLAKQPLMRVDDDLVQVHAGLHPRWTAKDVKRIAAGDYTQAEAEYCTHVRYCDAKGLQPERDWPPPGPPFRPWDDFYNGRRRVIFGHWARRKLVMTKRVIGLDTGACYGGPLTAWIAEDDRIVQVPGEKPMRQA